MPRKPKSYESFFWSKPARDARCADKDAITKKVLAGIRIRNPKKFTAVLMPSMYGPEVDWLKDRGVPGKNMFAIERIKIVWKTLAAKGMLTTPKPMSAYEAVDYIPWDKPVKLIYLDFYGQPNASHVTVFVKLLRLGLIGRGTRLLITFGVNRGDNFSCVLNKRLKGCTSYGHAYLDAAILKANTKLRYRVLNNFKYESQPVGSLTKSKFVVTEVRF